MRAKRSLNSKLLGPRSILCTFSIHSGCAFHPPKALGQVEATINYCAKAASKSADKHKEWGKHTTKTLTARLQLEEIPADKVV
jgi:hypothetical protein